MNKRKLFIVIEGTDGVGKTTVATGLAQKLGARYEKTPLRRLRQLALFFEKFNSAEIETISYFFLALISSLYFRWILRRQPLVCDKYILTTITAQTVLGGQLIKLVEKARYLLLPKPHYTFCLLVDSRGVLVSRFKQRGIMDRSDKQLFSFWGQIQEKYKSFPEVIPIDTTRIPPADVILKIFDYIIEHEK